MIKRIRFAARRAGVAAADFPAAWRGAVARLAEAPADTRPLRLSVCTVLPEVDTSSAEYEGICFEWFEDEQVLERFQDWLLTLSGQDVLHQINDVADRDRSPVVVADEIVARGADWLERRWLTGGQRVKHVALARRAAGLTPAEFSRRWAQEAGHVRPTGEDVVAIPEDVLGQAYVQNHPRPRSTGDWAYDAINEVYFDDLAHLEKRAAWFRENAPAPDGGLFRDSCFLLASEEALPTAG